MTTYHLITLTPLARLRSHPNGVYPAVWKRAEGNPPPEAGEGMAWAIVVDDQPAFDSATHTMEKKIYELDGQYFHGSKIRTLTHEEISASTLKSVPRVPFQMALREVLGLLFSDLEAYINAMPDALDRDLAMIRFRGEQNVRTDDALIQDLSATMEANNALPINPATITEELPAGRKYTAAEATKAVFTRAFEIQAQP